ncbi:unnamed protein product [Acanthoscelides obtectus]|uniref:Uncharacterized protein n=1 Tax=Acanthoscelides obtectus TaxID=200917 RepID=A0A9P0PZM8_ACAOB|nr:unnamed protein product [Acanthoscelides obtectus]CAK1680522.1 hypothetical protein AOBTE_LOCUS32724 [Acanthoscelides obtectus]
MSVIFLPYDVCILYLALRTGSFYAFVENIWKFVRAQPTISKIFEIHQSSTSPMPTNSSATDEPSAQSTSGNQTAARKFKINRKSS